MATALASLGQCAGQANITTNNGYVMGVNYYDIQQATSNSIIWPFAYSTGSVTTNNIWDYWQQVYGQQAIGGLGVNAVQQATPQQIAQYQEHQAAVAQREQERLAAVRVAGAKAESFLRSVLSSDQRAQYEAKRTFEVLLCKSGKTKRYEFTRAHAGNVFLLDEKGRRIERFCVHVDHGIPVDDNLVTQKLLLEADEEAFRKLANVTKLVA